MIGQTVSHYRIIEKLGEGGMGVVYRAEDTTLARYVAIKFLSSLDRPDRARFLREARAVSALTHPNIATVYDYGETDDGQPYIVMELVKGQTLTKLLGGGGLTLAKSVQITVAIAEALGEAHRLGIVHRDVKPSNVVVSDRGQIKVLDFGLVKQLNEQISHTGDPNAATLFSTRTRSDVIVGTPLYLSPEQASGKAVDGRSDLFSLGALFYECIAGQSAFSGSNVLEIGAQIIHVSPPPPSELNPRVPAELDRIALRALQKNVELRYQSAEELLKDLKAALAFQSADGERTASLPNNRDTPMFREKETKVLIKSTIGDRRKRLSPGVLLIAIAVAAAAIWTVIHFWPRSFYEPPAAALFWYDRGTARLRNGAYYQASKALQQAIAIDNRYALAHARLAQAWAELDYGDRARDELLSAQTLARDRSSLAPVDALYLDAIASTVTRDYATVVKAYSEIAGLSPSDPHVYVDLGYAYEKSGKLDKAIENYLKAIALNGQHAAAYLRAGIVYERKQDIPKATAAFDEAERLYRAESDLEGVNEVLRQRGILFRDKGNYPGAQSQFEQSLETARAVGNDSQEINAMIELSYLAYIEGNTTLAHDFARKAVEFAQQRQLETLVTRSLIELGNSFKGRGDYDEAEKYFRQAIDLARAKKDGQREAAALLNLGGVYIHQRRTDEGLPLVQQALSYYQQASYPNGILPCLTEIARVHRIRANYEAALQALEQRMQLAKQGGDQPQIAFTYGEIGAVLFDQERFPEALKQYDQAYDINKSIGNQVNIAYNQANRGNILWVLGLYDEAEKAFSDAYEIARKPDTGYKQLIPEIERSYAQMALSQRDFFVARARAETALKLAGTQYKNVTIEAQYTLGLTRALTGLAREGKTSCEVALKMATEAEDAVLLSKAMLVSAEVLLKSGDARRALDRATKVQANFASSGQQESEWRAWLIAALASQRLGDKKAAQEQLAHAQDVLAKLQQKWGPEVSKSYLARPDIQFYQKQLG